MLKFCALNKGRGVSREQQTFSTHNKHIEEINGVIEYREVILL
jgi:hypothetical protein